MYLEITFRNAKNQNQNCAAAAQDFLIALSKVYGDNIFKAILEGQDSRWYEDFVGFKQEASAGATGKDFQYPFLAA